MAVIAIVYRPPVPRAAALTHQPHSEPFPVSDATAADTATASAAASRSSSSAPVSPSSAHRRTPATFPLPPQPPPRSPPTPHRSQMQQQQQQWPQQQEQQQGPPSPRKISASSAGGSPSTSWLKRNKGASAAPRQPVFLHVANVGDCRAVLCRGGTAVAITRDHTPSVPTEAARVEAAGGFVSRGRVNGILGVSRSFGDIHCKVPFLCMQTVLSTCVELLRRADPSTSM